MLSIPNPCSEDFITMTPTERGAFCGKCQIDTIDFKGMSNAQIKETLIREKDNHICGEFFDIQIDEYNLLYFSKVERTPKYFFSILGVLLSTLFVSCQTSHTEVDKTGRMHSSLLSQKFLLAKPHFIKDEEDRFLIPPIELVEWDFDETEVFNCVEKEPIEIVGKTIEVRTNAHSRLGGEIKTSGGVPVATRHFEIEEKPGFFKRLFRKMKKNRVD